MLDALSTNRATRRADVAKLGLTPRSHSFTPNAMRAFLAPNRSGNVLAPLETTADSSASRLAPRHADRRSPSAGACGVLESGQAFEVGVRQIAQHLGVDVILPK
jgi:hypothetical protein